MNILIKVLVITIASAFLSLLFFDYDSTRLELNPSSKINCVEIDSPVKHFLCNTCFIVNPKGKYN